MNSKELFSFDQRQSRVLVTNFTGEYQHSNKGAAIAFLETQGESDVIAVADFECTPEDTFKLPYLFGVNQRLPQEERNKLLALLRRNSECFSSERRGE